MRKSLLPGFIKNIFQDFSQENTRKKLDSFFRANVIEVENVECLRVANSWGKPTFLNLPYLDKYEFLTDINFRRMIDADLIASAAMSINGGNIVEIGTSHGHMTTILSKNSPDSKIFTLNLPCNDQDSDYGKAITHMLPESQIGDVYRQYGCNNIVQILENSKTWIPDLPKIDLAFIDGCHDTEFVVGDTLKILPFMKKGSILIWHDFCPSQSTRYPWISDVCLGVRELYRLNHFAGMPLYHVRNSWCGVVVLC